MNVPDQKDNVYSEFDQEGQNQIEKIIINDGLAPEFNALQAQMKSVKEIVPFPKTASKSFLPVVLNLSEMTALSSYGYANSLFYFKGNNYSLNPDAAHGFNDTWRYNFEILLGPNNTAFVDAILNYQDIAMGLHLEHNPNGILWRVNDAGIPTYEDLNNYFEQNKVIEETNNKTDSEFKTSNINIGIYDDQVTDENSLTGAIKKGLIIDSTGKIIVNPDNSGRSVSDLIFYPNGNKQQAVPMNWLSDSTDKVSNYLSDTINKAKSYLNGIDKFELAKGQIEGLADIALGKMVIDRMQNTFGIFRQSAPRIGPAGTIEVAVDTTPGGVIALKNVSKVFGGVVSFGQTMYDVYVDYDTFGATKNFAMTATIDIGKTVGIAALSGFAVSMGAPIIVVAVAGGGIIYLVDTYKINPWKATLL